MRAVRLSATEDVTYSLDIRLLGQRYLRLPPIRQRTRMTAAGDEMMT